MESYLQRPEIAIACHVAYCQKSHISAGLVDVDIVNNHQMMGMIVNSLYQNQLAMIDAGLCT
eukprot:5379338-Ditylum_brightwellii.AAC.1